MNKYIYQIALTATALCATACSDDEVNDIQNIPDSEKEMISFSLSDGTTTRAGFTGAETTIAMRIQSNEKNGSGVKYTRTVASAAKDTNGSADSYSSVTFGNDYKRYWDDAHGRKSLLSVFAVAVPNGGNSITNNNQTLENLLTEGDATNTWGANAGNTIDWQVTTDAQEKDASGTSAPVKNIDKEDLVYSNNIQANATLGTDGIYRNYGDGNGYVPTTTGATTHKNGQMLFFQNGMTDADAASQNVSSAPGHFDKGHLKFKHALSRITITLVEGSGFDKTTANKDNDFKFATGTNITLLNMKVKGALDLSTGVWTLASTGGTSNIDKVAQTETGNYASNYSVAAHQNSKYYTFMAQMLPDYVLADGNNTNVMQFTIDNNTYFITQNMLYDALVSVNDNKVAAFGYDETTHKFTMMQGKNYKFTITVNKTEVQALTATLAKWEEVTGSMEMDNSHITVSTLLRNQTGDAACTQFNLYRWGQALDQIYTDDTYTANQYRGDYLTGGKASLEETTSGSHVWNTGWFYEDNQTAYHFRTLNNLAANGTGSDNSNITNTTGTPTVSSFKMVKGSEAQDYHWGAPMKTDADLKYDESTGFTNSIHKGIVSPKNNASNTINITELHMMSNIYVTLETTTGANKVDLSSASVRLIQLSTEASVDMGTGLITPNTQSNPENWLSVHQEMTAPSSSDYWQTTDTKTKPFSCAAIPQTLVRNTSPAINDYVGIAITTNDHNTYYVIQELSAITANSVTGGHNVVEGVAIERWYPGHKYYYTFKITKKGIENITCVLTDWIGVTAGNKDITLED